MMSNFFFVTDYRMKHGIMASLAIAENIRQDLLGKNRLAYQSVPMTKRTSFNMVSKRFSLSLIGEQKKVSVTCKPFQPRLIFEKSLLWKKTV